MMIEFSVSQNGYHVFRTDRYTAHEAEWIEGVLKMKFPESEGWRVTRYEYDIHAKSEDINR